MSTPTHTMDAAQFEAQFGFAPENDDLARVNCPWAGRTMHEACGLCPDHDNRPRFECGCRAVMRPKEA